MSQHEIGDQYSGDGAKHVHVDPKHADSEVPTIRPFRLLAYRERLSQRKTARENKHRDYRNMPEAELMPMYRKLDRAWENTRVRIARVGANGWMAFFTLVLTVATIASWAVMVIQNNIMRDQMKQADATIEQMRLEKRAWLGIVETRLGSISDDEIIDGQVVVENSGATPGTIYALDFDIVPLAKNADIKPEIDAMKRQVFTSSRTELQIVIPPGAKVTLPTGLRMGEDQAAAVTAGAIDVYFIGRFLYSDIYSSEYSTQCCLIQRESLDGTPYLGTTHYHNEMK
jgi:hypothetical protein